MIFLVLWLYLDCNCRNMASNNCKLLASSWCAPWPSLTSNLNSSNLKKSIAFNVRCFEVRFRLTLELEWVQLWCGLLFCSFLWFHDFNRAQPHTAHVIVIKLDSLVELYEISNACGWRRRNGCRYGSGVKVHSLARLLFLVQMQQTNFSMLGDSFSSSDR